MNKRKLETASLNTLPTQASENNLWRPAKGSFESLDSVHTHTLNQPRQRICIPLFETGQVLITRQALDYLSPSLIDEYLRKHVMGETDGCSETDLERDPALRYVDPIIYSRRDLANNTIYIVTEADRSTTTIMMEDEYH